MKGAHVHDLSQKIWHNIQKLTVVSRPFTCNQVSTVQSHFWRIWKRVLIITFAAPTTRANILIVTEKIVT